MRRRFNVIAMVGAVALLMSPMVATAQAEEPPEPPGEALTLNDRLVEAVDAGADTPEAVAEQLALPAEGGGSLNFDDAGRVSATVRFDRAPGDAETAALTASGAEVTGQFAMFSSVTVRVDPLSIKTIEQLPGVLGVELDLQAATSAELSASHDGAAQGRSTVRPALDPGVADCRTIPVEADAPLGSGLARAVFGTDGEGVTIGIISDSFRTSSDTITTPEEDVAAGALPGPGNPCGYETPVEILEPEVNGTDEGRAMAQLVHGIAPGAKLMFADAGENIVTMANNIYRLAAAGADIIVDDISYHSEPYFQRGLISAAIAKAKEDFGITYFTSAGNSNAAIDADGELTPVTSWQTDAYRPMECPAWVVQGPDDSLEHATGFDCLDFDPGAAELAYDTLWIDEGDGPFTMQPIASIGEAYLGVRTSYQLRFYEVDQSDPWADPVLLSAISAYGGALPGLSGRVEVAPESEVRLVMVRTAFRAEAPLPPVWLSFMRGGDAIASRHFMGDGAGDVVGPTAFGHAGDGSSISVASLHWDEPEKVRDYSSTGPGTLWFEDYELPDLGPRPLLAVPELVAAPNLAAVDGTATTFFGDPDDEGDYRFYGTSAAAPHAAAVAALGLSLQPGLSAAQLESFVLATARGSECCGPVNPYPNVNYDEVVGAGIVDAMALLVALAPSDLAAGETAADRATIEWQAQGEAEQFTLMLFEGEFSDEDLETLELPASGAGEAGETGPVGPTGVPAGAVSVSAVAAAPVVASALASIVGAPQAMAPTPVAGQTHTLPGGARTFTFTGLTPSTTYTVILVTHYGAGYQSAVLVPVTTAAPTPGPGPGPTPGPGPGPAPSPGGGGASGPLPALGATEDLTPWFIGGGALLVLLAAALITTAAVRRRRAAAKTESADEVSPRE